MQQGGSHYGASPPQPFPIPDPGSHPEAVRPISSFAPGVNLDEFASTAAAASLGPVNDADDGGERVSPPSNRWPQHETLTLIKIRSDMDVAFRRATSKGPLWEEVSRRLSEQGITRSAKKCKEKFENVHKYYRRTKENRAGRQDGKSYRFFSQLEALHSHESPQVLLPTPNVVTPTTRTTENVAVVTTPPHISENSSSESESNSDSDEQGDEMETMTEQGKRKKKKGGSMRKMMAFFDELMRRVVERQESMQRRFLDAIERREQDRMQREEAWKTQEMARLTREHESISRERTTAATRDTALIAFLQKISGQPTPTTANVSLSPPPQRQPPFLPPASAAAAVLQEQLPRAPEPVSSSSRWPKAEVHALIRIRSSLDTRYQDAGPKGPLWEEISAEMRKLGYDRSTKRCKEKWENINKYFKKVKESNKKRPDDSKTCPYFHQLDELYRRKYTGAVTRGDGSGTPSSRGQQPDSDPTWPLGTEMDSNGMGSQQPTNAGAISCNLMDGTSASGTVLLKKPEVILEELMMDHGHHQPYDDLEEGNVDEGENGEEQERVYKVEYQRSNPGGSVTSNGSTRNPAAARSSFLAMVQ